MNEAPKTVARNMKYLHGADPFPNAERGLLWSLLSEIWWEETGEHPERPDAVRVNPEAVAERCNQHKLTADSVLSLAKLCHAMGENTPPSAYPEKVCVSGSEVLAWRWGWMEIERIVLAYGFNFFPKKWGAK